MLKKKKRKDRKHPFPTGEIRGAGVNHVMWGKKKKEKEKIKRGKV